MRLILEKPMKGTEMAGLLDGVRAAMVAIGEDIGTIKELMVDKDDKDQLMARLDMHKIKVKEVPTVGENDTDASM